MIPRLLSDLHSQASLLITGALAGALCALLTRLGMALVVLELGGQPAWTSGTLLLMGLGALWGALLALTFEALRPSLPWPERPLAQGLIFSGLLFVLYLATPAIGGNAGLNGDLLRASPQVMLCFYPTALIMGLTPAILAAWKQSRGIDSLLPPAGMLAPALLLLALIVLGQASVAGLNIGREIRYVWRGVEPSYTALEMVLLLLFYLSALGCFGLLMHLPLRGSLFSGWRWLGPLALSLLIFGGAAQAALADPFNFNNSFERSALPQGLALLPLVGAVLGFERLPRRGTLSDEQAGRLLTGLVGAAVLLGILLLALLR